MQRWKKHVWTGALLTASVVLILAAVVVGAVRLIDLAAPKYRERLAAEMSESLDLPVTIGGIGMSWQLFRPTFELDEVIVLDDQRRPAFQVAHIGLPFMWSSLLRGELFPYMIELRGLAVALEWRADGSVGIRGVGEAAEGGELDVAEIFSYLEKINRIEVEEGVVNWSDFGAPIGLTRVEQVNVVLEKAGKGVHLALEGRLPKHLGEDFHFDADLKGALSRPDELQIHTRFRTESLYADGWLAPVLRDTAALRGGPMTVEFASQWQGLSFQNAALRLAVSPLSDVGTGEEHPLPGLDAELRFSPLGDGWDMKVLSLQYWRGEDRSPVTQGHFRYQPTPDGFGTRLDADLDSLRVADLLSWLSVLNVAGDMPLPRGEQVRGNLQSLRFEYRQAVGAQPQYEVQAQVQGLALPAVDGLPGVTGLSGKLYATDQAGRFDAKVSNARLDLPQVFEQVLPLSRFDLGLAWEKQGEAWRIFTDKLETQVLTARATGSLNLLLDDAPSPAIDLKLAFEATDILPLKPYIPKPPALPGPVGEWLQASLAGGTVPEGTMQLKGRLADFPYENPGEPGVFRIEFQARDASLSYAPDWPVVDRINGHAVFHGRSMYIEAGSGRIIGVPIGKTVAEIPDFLDPVLIIRGTVQADVGRQLGFLGASPLRSEYQGLLDAISLSGPGRLDLDLRMPLSDVEAVRISGDIDMQGAQLKYSSLDKTVDAIRGQLHFSEKGLSAEHLSGQFLGLPLTARLTPVEKDGRQLTHLQATAHVRLPEHKQPLSAYVSAKTLSALSGESEVVLESTFDASASASELSVYSNFQGMRSTLGEPFAKEAGESREFKAVIQPASRQTDMRWHYSDQLHGLLRFVTSGEVTRLHVGKIFLGDAPALAWPLQPGMYVEGELPLLDLNNLAPARSESDSQLPPLYVNAELGELRVAGQTFRKLGLSSGGAGKPLSARQGQIAVSGADAEGMLSWKQQEGGRLAINGEFNHLNLKVPGSLFEEEESQAGDKVQAEPVDPAQLPVLNLSVKNFRLGDEGLGHLRLVTQAMPVGVRLSTLEIGGRRIEVRGGGQWQRENGQSSARLLLNINGNDIVGLLNATGYAPSITAEQADVFMEVDWAPAASGLEMEQLNGKMSFDLVDGSLLEVKPGAGRVLSLLSFYSLPRRLTLDFSDVLGKGTAFDKLTGVFAIEKGNATTDDLVVTTPSARIEVRGRVGLAAQDYDQVVTIYPGVASGVALAGAVLGGPVLGIGLWLAQELLEKPLDQVAKLSYRLTGSWDEPVVEPLGAEVRKSPANPAPAADNPAPPAEESGSEIPAP